MDNLHIKALSVTTCIGVYEWEQKIAQRLLIDIAIPIEVSACQDNIENTVDYEKLCQLVTNHVEAKTFRLIETVANEVAQLIKAEFNLAAVTITVSKPHAIKNAANVCITVVR